MWCLRKMSFSLGWLYCMVTSMTEQDETDPLLMTPGEVAKMLRVDPKTVTRWANAKPPKIRSLRTPGGHRRFYTEDIWKLVSGGKL